jgi:hypothetical protein
MVDTNSRASPLGDNQLILPHARRLAHVMHQAQVPGKLTCAERVAEASCQLRGTAQVISQPVPAACLIGAMRP